MIEAAVVCQVQAPRRSRPDGREAFLVELGGVVAIPEELFGDEVGEVT